KSDAWLPRRSPTGAPWPLLLAGVPPQVSGGRPPLAYPGNGDPLGCPRWMSYARAETMIRTGSHATVLVSTGRHGPLRNSRAPLEHHGPTMWKIAAHAGKESRPRPAFPLVTALIAGAPEGTRTPNLLIRSRRGGGRRSQPCPTISACPISS